MGVYAHTSTTYYSLAAGGQTGDEEQKQKNQEGRQDKSQVSRVELWVPWRHIQSLYINVHNFRLVVQYVELYVAVRDRSDSFFLSLVLLWVFLTFEHLR